MRTKPSQQAAEDQPQQPAYRRALEAVQEALDRRDHGGDAAAATEN